QPAAGWEEKREAAYAAHLQSLSPVYFEHGRQRLRSEQGWARGLVKRPKIDSGGVQAASVPAGGSGKDRTTPTSTIAFGRIRSVPATELAVVATAAGDCAAAISRADRDFWNQQHAVYLLDVLRDYSNTSVPKFLMS